VAARDAKAKALAYLEAKPESLGLEAKPESLGLPRSKI
jgi:hypothetical protein